MKTLNLVRLIRVKDFGLSVKPVNPKCLIAEPMSTSRVPSCKSSEHDLFFRQLKRVDPQLIGARVWLEGFDSVRAQNMIEDTLKTRVG